MVLAEWNGAWYLSTGVNVAKGLAWLRARSQMPHPPEFKPVPPSGWMVYGSAPLGEVKFYPELYWESLPVSALQWKQETVEPVLLVRMETHGLPVKCEKEYLQLVEVMRTLGWTWDVMEGGHRYLHVNELEKRDRMPRAEEF